MTEKEKLRAELRLRGVDVPDSWSLKQLRNKKAELEKDADPVAPTDDSDAVPADPIPPTVAAPVAPVVPQPAPPVAKVAAAPEDFVIQPKFDFSFQLVEYKGGEEYPVTEWVGKELIKQGIANRVS